MVREEREGQCGRLGSAAAVDAPCIEEDAENWGGGIGWKNGVAWDDRLYGCAVADSIRHVLHGVEDTRRQRLRGDRHVNFLPEM